VRSNPVLVETRAILSLLPENLISLRLFYWTFPISIVVSITLIPLQIKSVEEFLSWFYIGVLGHLAMLPFVIYAKGRDRNKEQIPLLLMMGIVRGGTIGLLAPLFGVVDPLTVQIRTLNSTLSVFYWFQIAAIIFEFRSEFRKKIKNLVEEMILKDAIIKPNSYNVNSNELILLIAELQKKIVNTLSGEPTPQKLSDRARDIDALVRKQLRPLSKSQWYEGELIWVKAGFLRVLKSTMSVAPIHIWAVVLLTLPYSIIGHFNRYGFLNTVVTQITWLIMAWLVQQTAKRLFKGHDGNYFKQNLAIVLAIPVVIAPIAFLIHAGWPSNAFSIQNLISAQIFSAITVSIITLSSTLVIALHEEQREVFEMLGNALKEKDLEMLVRSGVQANSESDYAQYLHAEVQSQLLACKLLLLKAADSDFTLFSPEITNQIIARLEKIQQPYERPAARVPSARVLELEKSWKGLAEITNELSPELQENSAFGDIVAQLIEESVVNAIRHGKANKIHVNSFSTSGLINVVITDNGQLKEGQTGSGLGTILFDTFAKSWTIGREGDATVVKFSVATRAE
jgi:hypothetical protein